MENDPVGEGIPPQDWSDNKSMDLLLAAAPRGRVVNLSNATVTCTGNDNDCNKIKDHDTQTLWNSTQPAPQTIVIALPGTVNVAGISVRPGSGGWIQTHRVSLSADIYGNLGSEETEERL